MHNRLKQLHECYMEEKQNCNVAHESRGHQEMMKNFILEMWAINEMMDKPEHYQRIESHYEKDHCAVNNAPLSREEAHTWVSHMKANGVTEWKPWTVEETTTMLHNKGLVLGELSDWCANALLNMIWSDNPQYNTAQIIAEAKKYIADPDVPPAGKRLGLYYRYIVNG